MSLWSNVGNVKMLGPAPIPCLNVNQRCFTIAVKGGSFHEITCYFDVQKPRKEYYGKNWNSRTWILGTQPA